MSANRTPIRTVTIPRPTSWTGFWREGPLGVYQADREKDCWSGLKMDRPDSEAGGQVLIVDESGLADYIRRATLGFPDSPGTHWFFHVPSGHKGQVFVSDLRFFGLVVWVERTERPPTVWQHLSGRNDTSAEARLRRLSYYVPAGILHGEGGFAIRDSENGWQPVLAGEVQRWMAEKGVQDKDVCKELRGLLASGQ